MGAFGTDGIRGVAGKGPLTPANVRRIGRALAGHAADLCGGTPHIVLGRDPRPSGDSLVRALASAMGAEGARVVDLGVVPTPAVAWAVAVAEHDLGVAVSASHNPATHNGIKPFAAGGRKLTRPEEEDIEARIADAPGEAVEALLAETVEGAARYVEATAPWLEREGTLEGLHLVVDLAAGAASTTAPAVLRALGARVTALHPAGSRPINEGCGTQHPEAFREAVRREGADAGVAFDGDADRMLLADAEGHLLDGDDALVLLAEDWLRRGRLPHACVVGTVMSNLGVEEHLASRGIHLDRTAVGDRNVAERMRERGAVIGAEPSGHVVLEREGALIGDGLVAAVRVLQAARRRDGTLAAHRAALARYPQRLRSVPVRERVPLEQADGLQQALEEARQALGEHGRLVVRYSGTEPVLRIMAEGPEDDLVDEIVAALEAEAARTLG